MVPLAARALLLALLPLTTAGFAESPPAPPDPASTKAYIERAWSTLSRSMQDCAALTDPKVAARPVIYVPAQFQISAELSEVGDRKSVV